MAVQDYVVAIVFGAIIGVVARVLLPGRQRIGLIPTVLIGMGSAAAGTWIARRWGVDSHHYLVVGGHSYDWLVLGVQVGIAIVGVAIAAMLARAFSTDREE
ncbi:GlsB/YeaQ/YmgE family stress response membrane protein [Mangrovihabitans endophyticus]|uniref:GlsB/YeaQ/YmgE family stress response membrane protein n=1 Tax=Mangrovihabitans endophyticus TaxID=1751298 RepID=UPI001667D2CD|nr:GlsB/YeaQ/YmgE family stress response membrane protein [Mangrovihabitans endophyticus]